MRRTWTAAKIPSQAGKTAVVTGGSSGLGLETALATNYLGHFALTAHLLPALAAAPQARVVSVGSLSHWFGRIHFDDLHLERRFRPTTAYEQSKLAMVLFGLELHRRARAARLRLLSVPAHPGIANTDIFQRSLVRGSIKARVVDVATRVVGQSAAQGALPVIFAAVAPEVESGRYYGPNGLLEIQGYPAIARLAPRCHNRDLAARLWEVSERLTGVTYRFGTEHETIAATSTRVTPEICNGDRPASL